jgi:glycosyltransferase involved in cell wall biosynthesis
VNVTIVASSLLPGGAEQALVLMARGLRQQGHEVAVVTLYPAEHDFFNLPDDVRRLALDIAADSPTIIHALRNNLQRLRRLRRAVRSTRPDVVVSHLNQVNVLTLLALFGTDHPVIAVEHVNPAANTGGKVWEALRRLTYPQAAQVVCVSRGIADCFSWIPEQRRRVIYNPLPPHLAEVRRNASAPGSSHRNGQRRLVAMGRLIQRKGFDLLLSAFHAVSEQHPDWHLVIMGEGEMRPTLERQRDELGLAARVSFLGLVDQPFPLLKSSDLFVLPSRSEGFPYALLEAMSCGLPVISTDCPSGPREIIRDGVDGILVPNGDAAALASALGRLMGDEGERTRLAGRAPEVGERFGMEKTMRAWEELLTEAVNGRRQSRHRDKGK